ncbi:hypothetical protein NAT51_08385 [Flavobacterium amniphilum]|uniref:hypothetical protein n=1 Tax=Flavobacterium amniphilum TaxID=1834035 RepID=UPI00202A7E5D|nr:hypothetical protein [Flavobacterium amniphilum]MCL9805537.1 hypothetical protein [Flavobacterium amniphilum]
MTYSLDKLTTTTDCDAVLNSAQREKRDLEFKKIGDVRFTENFSFNSVETQAELQVVLAELAGCEIALSMLAPGKKRDTEILRKANLEHRKFVIEHKKSGIALVERELDLVLIDKKLEGIDDFIVAVTAHKATLPN